MDCKLFTLKTDFLLNMSPHITQLDLTQDSNVGKVATETWRQAPMSFLPLARSTSEHSSAFVKCFFLCKLLVINGYET
jgi:hypothetical protein